MNFWKEFENLPQIVKDHWNIKLKDLFVSNHDQIVGKHIQGQYGEQFLFHKTLPNHRSRSSKK